MTPDGVRALQPTDFAKHFYLVANGSDGEVSHCWQYRYLSGVGSMPMRGPSYACEV